MHFQDSCQVLEQGHAQLRNEMYSPMTSVKKLSATHVAASAPPTLSKRDPENSSEDSLSVRDPRAVCRKFKFGEGANSCDRADIAVVHILPQNLMGSTGPVMLVLRVL